MALDLRNPNEVVYGMVGRSGRVRLSTETRTLGNDAAAQRNFARYWRLIYPGSAIIRRVWLDAIAGRART